MSSVINTETKKEILNEYTRIILFRILLGMLISDLVISFAITMSPVEHDFKFSEIYSMLFVAIVIVTSIPAILYILDKREDMKAFIVYIDVGNKTLYDLLLSIQTKQFKHIDKTLSAMTIELENRKCLKYAICVGVTLGKELDYILMNMDEYEELNGKTILEIMNITANARKKYSYTYCCVRWCVDKWFKYFKRKGK